MKSEATPTSNRAPSGSAEVGARTSPTADQTIVLVGARIRSLRSRQNLTLKDVAERTGVSVSMLSMLERGVATASVGTLVSVASALGVHMYDLFDHPDVVKGSPVTLATDQAVLRTSEGTTRRVAHSDTQAGLEMAVNEYEPGSASGPHATHHDGREFGVVIKGRLTVELEDDRYEVGPGDVIAYSSSKPHRIINDGSTAATAVWINLDGG
jgi:transcriptional regulator with XRE-family HTH domain